MRESYRTAKDIFDELTRLNEEVKELSEALSAIAEGLGDDHIGYTLLKKQYDVKVTERREAERVEFVAVTTPKAPAPHISSDIQIFGSLPPGVR